MSQPALTDFAKIAQQLADALDKHRPTQGNQTLVVLSELSGQLPEDNPLRQSIEQQMAKIAATDFALDNQDLNKTLIILGTLKGRLKPTDVAQEKIDILMAKILAAKFDIVNGQQSPASVEVAAEQPEPQPQPEAEADKPVEPVEPVEPVAEPAAESRAKYSISVPDPQPEALLDAPVEPEVEPVAELPAAALEESASVEPIAEPQPAPDQAPVTTPPSESAAAPIDAFADQIHTLQIALDQLPASTIQAFTELKAIEDQGGTVKAFVEQMLGQANANDQAAIDRVKTELERLSVLLAKIEDAPAEADQFQVLYDQVDAKHKDLKTGVFSIFQSEYGGNARRFVVERTAQYAKYVTADESRQRMIEDLHKLIEQAQKSLGQANSKGSASNDKPAKTNNRAFFHG